jgi:multidrug resistance efflux pump
VAGPAAWDDLLDPAQPPDKFLGRFVSALAEACQATGVAIWALDTSSPDPRGWRCVRHTPGDGVASATVIPAATIDAIAESAARQGVSVSEHPAGVSTLVAVPLHGAGRPSLIVASIAGLAPGSAGEAALRLKLASAFPHLFATSQNLARAEREVSRFASCLDLMAGLAGETRFHAAAMFLVNELAARFGCSGVALGWVTGHRVTVAALSNTEKFEPKMEAVQKLSAAMEESVDQGEEIVFPAPDGSTAITRDHAAYARSHHSDHLLTVPLALPLPLAPAEHDAVAARRDTAGLDGVVGAVTLERANGPAFTSDEARTLRVVADQAARRLSDLRRSDRWFGARAAAALRERAATLIGPSHTAAKLVGVVLAIALAVLVFGKKRYSAEATFVLEPETVSYLPAPFEGFLDEVNAEPGDRVTAGQVLFTLDRRELLLQRQAAAAEKERFAGEAIDAESGGDTAAMRVARARLTQAEAQLELTDYRLGQAAVVAPFDGVVTEGDLRERTRSPVKQGEVLMKVAQLAPLHPEAKVGESEVLHVREGASGSIAFASRPELDFPIEVTRLVPVARAGDEGNTFTLRCRFAGEGAPPDWWRPGMGGVAKIDAGRRSLLWIYTHKTIDWLRLKLF